LPKLILLEGLPKYENVNEAYAIADALEIMKKSCDGRRARHLKIIPHTAENKADFMRWLEKDTDFLHISAHGDRVNNQTILKITRNGTLTPKEVAELNIKAKVIFMNACQQSRKDMAEAFFKAGKPKYRFFIAPFKEVPFDEAFLIALLFYKNAFLERTSLENSKSLFKALEKVYTMRIKTSYFFWEWPYL